MQENCKLGFTYDVTQLSPNGDIVSHQIVKNLLTTHFLAACLYIYFKLGSVDFSLSSSPYYLNFLRNDYKGNINDKWIQTDIVKYGFSSLPSINTTNGFTGLTFSFQQNDNTSVVAEYTKTFDTIDTLTGVFITKYMYLKNPTQEFFSNSKNITIASVAPFLYPVQMFPNGTLNIKISFSGLPQ